MKRIMLSAISLFIAMLCFPPSESAGQGAFWSDFTVPLPPSVTNDGITVKGPFRVEDIDIIEESTAEILGACVFGDSNSATTGPVPSGYSFSCERSQDGNTAHITVSSNQANLPLIKAHLVTVRSPHLSVEVTVISGAVHYGR